MRRPFSVAVAVVVCLLAATTWNTASRAGDLPIVTGEHWTKADDEQKRAFLIGFGTMLKAEHNAQADNPKAQAKDSTLVTTLVNGLSKFTIQEVLEQINSYYQINPDKVMRPVIEVMWFEIAVPNVR
jgi:hypothetical protein